MIKMTPALTPYRTIIMTLLGLLALSLVLMVIGVATPGWNRIHLGNTEMTTNTGIWYVRYCPDNGPCWTESIPAAGEESDPNGMLKHIMLQYQVCSTLAIAFCIAGIAFLGLLMTSLFSLTTEVMMCFYFCIIGMIALVSGLLSVHISAAFGSQIKKLHDVNESQPSSSEFYVPYSVFLVFFGGVASLAVLVIIVTVRPWRWAPVKTNDQTPNGARF